MRKVLSLLVGLVGCGLFALAGCGGSGGGTNTGAALGEDCEDGSDCQSGLFCFVAVDGEPGECMTIPAACADDPKCSGDCFDGVGTECKMGKACVVFGGSVTVACGTVSN